MALDYVKNRPFYSESPALVDIVPERTIGLYDDEMAWAELDSYELGKATKGDQFFVWWDGVQYECYADAEDVDIFIGNPGIWYDDMEQDNGVPFVIECLDGCFVRSYAFDGDHTIRVAKMVETVHTIDPKYIKDMYHTTEEEFVLCTDEKIGFGSNLIQTSIGCDMPFFVVGRTYKVILNNIHYVCVAFAGFNGYAWIGNPSFGGNGGEDNGMPFAMCIDYYDEIGGNSLIFVRNKSGVEETYSFTITAIVEAIHALDPKYLPCDMRIELNGYLWSNITADDVRITSGNVQNVINKIWRGELVNVRVRSVVREGSYMAQAKEIEADVCYYAGWLIVNWLCASTAGWYAKRITFNADGTVKGVINKHLTTTT